MSPEERAKSIVGDWYYTGRSGSGNAAHLLAKSIAEALRQAAEEARKEGADELEQRLWTVIEPASVPSDIVEAVSRLAQSYRARNG